MVSRQSRQGYRSRGGARRPGGNRDSAGTRHWHLAGIPADAPRRPRPGRPQHWHAVRASPRNGLARSASGFAARPAGWRTAAHRVGEFERRAWRRTTHARPPRSMTLSWPDGPGSRWSSPISGPVAGDDPVLGGGRLGGARCAAPRPTALMRTARLVDAWGGPIPWLVLNRVEDRRSGDDTRLAVLSGWSRRWCSMRIQTVGLPGTGPSSWMVEALRPLHAALAEPGWWTLPGRSRDGVARPGSPASARKWRRNRPDRGVHQVNKEAVAPCLFAGAGLDPGRGWRHAARAR